MRLTLGDGTTIDIEPGDELAKVRFRHDTLSRNGLVETADVAVWARDLLRAIDGPSVEDVAWAHDVPRAYVEVMLAANGSDVHVCIGLYTFTAATLREAMQAAYDAGVARRGE